MAAPLAGAVDDVISLIGRFVVFERPSRNILPVSRRLGVRGYELGVRRVNGVTDEGLREEEEEEEEVEEERCVILSMLFVLTSCSLSLSFLTENQRSVRSGAAETSGGCERCRRQAQNRTQTKEPNSDL